MRNSGRIRTALLTSLLLGALPLAAPVRAEDAGDRLAAALGLDPDSIEKIETTVDTLADGRRIETVKAIDRATGEIVGVALDGERVVDRYAEIRRAGDAWRARHGAVTPDLRRHLDQLGPADRLRVTAWLAVDLSALPDERLAPKPTGREAGSALGEAAGPDPDAPVTRADAAPELSKGEPGDLRIVDPRREAHREAVQAALRAEDAERQRLIRELIAPARADFLGRVTALDLDITFAGELSPLVVLEGRREVLEELAFWPEIDALYDASGQGGPLLANARPTQNMLVPNNVGYDGTGVEVSITEGERASFANPFLTLSACYACGQPYASHPTAVGGMVRSTDATQHGLADEVDLHSANGSYSDFGVMSAAMEWGSSNARVLNNSWYWDSANNPNFWSVDRQMDYFVRSHFDTVVVAAGNFGNGCGGNFSTYVTSPAKGHNILAVGNYDDLDSLTWTGDVMSNCSSFGNPNNSAGTGTQEKPEIAGVGSSITSTTTSSPWIGPVGSGTSYSAPMVTALAADVMEVDPAIENDPEAVKALLMATAIHNVEGATRLSDKDGAGGIVGAAAAASAERGNWAVQSIGSTTTFPINYSQYAYAGERVRFAIAWSTNPNAAYTTDPLPADIDLCAYRADNTTVITCSSSVRNAYEIIDFIAPASETYRFRASLFSSDWSSGGTWLGAGWWRGEYRIVPEVGYTDQVPAPTGTHLAVFPADWSPNNYWRAVGIRPAGTSDHDLELASHSLFVNPGVRTVNETSTYAGSAIDFVAVDGNHRTTTQEHYRVYRFAGTDGYNLQFTNLGLGAGSSSSPITLGPVTHAAANVLSVFDVWVPAASHRRVRVVPVSGSADLAIYGYRSDPANSTSWTKRKSEYVLARNRSSSGTATERGGLNNPAALGDWLGLVVANLTGGAVSFQVIVLPASLFSDDFEGGDLLEWSATAL